MSQSLALSACSAWASGMEAKAEGYMGRELDRELDRIEEESLTSND